MDTSKLENFAQIARQELLEQVDTQIQLVLTEQSRARREQPETVRELEQAIAEAGREQVVERVAYTWFNRFSALRFMDARHYTSVGIVSPGEGQSQPEILAEAKSGEIDEDLIPVESVRARIFGLLRGQITSSDPQGEAYRLLLVSVCNYWNQSMPYMFGRIHDYMELLMPADLLSEQSIPVRMCEVMTEEDCQDVEIIGWLYQFYIAEKKEKVFTDIKRNIKVSPENIPAATQFFTPHWIVRYLVENSLGRLWMLNHPESRLVDRMEYYISPDEPEEDFLKISSPEEIRICDPACGSGHMLTYAFDLLYAMYEEEAYDAAEIPAKILTKNLAGIEIDERAGSMAAFALMMKAREKQRTIFRKKVTPNICVLQDVHVSHDELIKYLNKVCESPDIFSLAEIVSQFKNVDIAGSLLHPNGKNVSYWWDLLKEKTFDGDMALQATHKEVLKALRQSEILSTKYHVILANPPYMGSKGMNARLSSWAKREYTNSKSNLFAMFMERSFELIQKQGLIAMITMQSWMFLSSYEKLREKLVSNYTILTMAHLGANAFEKIKGEIVSTTSFVIINKKCENYKGVYIRLIDEKTEYEKRDKFLEILSKKSYFKLSINDFGYIPGNPIAYWVNKNVYNAFKNFSSLSKLGYTRRGLQTGCSDLFIRNWYEVSKDNIGTNMTKEEAEKSGKRWFLFSSGGTFRKWYGNIEDVVNWFNDGEDIKNTGNAIIPNEDLYFKEAITWPKVSSSRCSFRWFPNGIIPGDAGPCLYSEHQKINILLCFLNTKVTLYFLKFMSPTMNFEVGTMAKLPIYFTENDFDSSLKAVKNAKYDWDSYETSWDFATLPLLSQKYHKDTLKETYQALRSHWKQMTEEMQKLEEENNSIFIDAYGLKDELTPDVPLKEITLTCNPHYRYGGEKSEEELEKLLLADTMREFISYAVGCMFGRYSLDAPGLILANQGDSEKDYYLRLDEKCDWKISDEVKKKVTDSSLETSFKEAMSALRAEAAQHCSFMPDEDNVIPILEDTWFVDDLAGRFQNFVKVTFGEKHLQENLHFIEEALGKNLRKYFLKDFYTDHIKRYKKRPIYWLFSSAKGGFNALIYMHRYTPDTVNIVLNTYLREFKTKLSTQWNALAKIEESATATQTRKAQATRERTKIRSLLKEVEEYERDLLYPLATRKIQIDLDDGVRVNYPRFGAALKKIPGLEARED